MNVHAVRIEDSRVAFERPRDEAGEVVQRGVFYRFCFWIVWNELLVLVAIGDGISRPPLLATMQYVVNQRI